MEPANSYSSMWVEYLPSPNHLDRTALSFSLVHGASVLHHCTISSRLFFSVFAPLFLPLDIFIFYHFLQLVFRLTILPKVVPFAGFIVFTRIFTFFNFTDNLSIFSTGLISDPCVWEIFTDLTMIIVFYAILHLYLHPRIFPVLSWSFYCP